MVAAIVIAGGVGRRMGADVPKQFVEVGGRPVIAYTLEAFERHPDVDAIEVVCLEGWEGELRAIASRSGISKLRWVAPGGATGQESIRNGVYALEGELDPGDVCLVHDGVRPMLDPEVISDVVRVCRERGNAVSSMPYNEQIFLVDGGDPSTTTESIPRETVRRVSTPQAYRYGELLATYREAFERGVGVGPSDYANTMMVKLGVRLNFAAGSDRNVKLTTPENLEFFRAWATGRGTAPAGSARAGRLGSRLYMDEVDAVCARELPWDELDGRVVAISGATGMIGAFLVDVLMRRREAYGTHMDVLALGRSAGRARERLPHFGQDGFAFEELDVSVPGALPRGRADYVLHLASATHPKAYASDPIGTVDGNVFGLRNLLAWADACSAALLFASSVEVYGEASHGQPPFGESDMGYLDCNTTRAAYNESKRLGEAMCQAWRSQRGVPVRIARIARVYGPTLLPTDTKALSQFIHRALSGEDVVLKSEGTQEYSYLHVADAVSGLLHVLLKGRDGEAYNLADEGSDVTLRELAQAVADAGGVGLVLGLPDAAEAAGYSKATRALMDGRKARGELGWRAAYDIARGVPETVAIMREANL